MMSSPFSNTCNVTSVCRYPCATIRLEFEEYTWREGEFLYLQVCAVGTDVAFPLTAEIDINDRTGTCNY
jgi:hypothetical protein